MYRKKFIERNLQKESYRKKVIKICRRKLQNEIYKNELTKVYLKNKFASGLNSTDHQNVYTRNLGPCGRQATLPNR